MKPPRLSLLIAFASLALAAPAHAPEDPTIAFVNKVLDLTNAQRTKSGLVPLKLESHLVDSAHWKAKDMASRNYFGHDDTGGRGFVERARKFSYIDWKYLGENIAAGQSTPEEVVAEWMASRGHRANILRPEFREIGIACASDQHSEFKTYWVQEFGAK